MFRDYLALKKNEYLKKLKIEEEIAERFPPVTTDERLEFFLRRCLIIFESAVIKHIISLQKIFYQKRRKRPQEIIMPEISYILLSCCTFMRPDMLENTLSSIKNLIFPENIKIEILVIDNSKEQSARNVVKNFSEKTGINSHYFMEERRGLAFARNRLLQEAITLGASHIMMFDDDEILMDDALIEHIKLCKSYEKAIVSSGVVINKFDEKTPNYIKKNIVFKQKTTKKTGTIKQSCTGGNVFFPLALIKEKNIRFSEQYVFMGGEDGEFFSRLAQNGYKIVQNSNSKLYEIVTSARANIKYILRKSYYNGFAGSYFKFKNKPIGKVFYIIKQFMIFICDVFFILPALILGITGFVNFLAMSIRAAGKIMGVISQKPIEFYKELYNE